MKIRFITTFFMVLLGFQSLKAQQDLQINLSNLIFYELHINYEIKEVIDKGTLGFFGGYVYGLAN